VLEGQQQQIATRAAGLNANLPAGVMPHSGIANSYREYQDKSNREGEIAGLRSELSGDGPLRVGHSYAGTEFAMGPATQALQRRAQQDADMAPGDNLDFYGRQAQVQGMQANADTARTGALRAATIDDPVMRARRRDLESADTVAGGRAAGMADAAGYLAPGQDDARRTKLRDDEARRKALAPYDPAAIRGDATRDAAQIAADSRLGVADRTAGARESSAAINGLMRGASAFTQTPEQEARVAGAMDTVRPLIPGQRQAQIPSRAGDFGGDNVLTRAELEALSRQTGQSVDWHIADAQRRGYAVR
jgi:hypothetical protein